MQYGEQGCEVPDWVSRGVDALRDRTARLKAPWGATAFLDEVEKSGADFDHNIFLTHLAAGRLRNRYELFDEAYKAAVKPPMATWPTRYPQMRDHMLYYLMTIPDIAPVTENILRHPLMNQGGAMAHEAGSSTNKRPDADQEERTRSAVGTKGAPPSRIEEYEEALDCAFMLYGLLKARTRLRMLVAQFTPYIALMLGAGLGDIVRAPGRLIGNLTSLNQVHLFPTASAASFSAEPIGRSDVIAAVFLVLFVCTFLVTLRDEFFTTKPRPISRDLNRSFVGFILGTLTRVIAGT
jgi:hypothetical protein